ncbi:cell division control protein 42 [Venturia nashicola]|uniref:Cell division control protein 42 n=1 Tax=Venturia nashicola TaxID=86259 RepID=A0A4Z1P1V2_9PEZI|nr:cell division control protein 42 [Venturia nashicola]
MAPPAKEPEYQIQDPTISETERTKSHEALENPSLANVKEEESEQAGTRKIEAITSSWSKWGLFVAYISLMLMANSTSLEGQVTTVMTPYATSAYSAHSLVSTISVIQGVVNSVIKPPMSKVADVFGRLESFSLAIFLFTIGYIQQAASNNVRTFASAQIFYSAGSQGLQILQQVFAADTTDLLNRALFSTIFDIPFLWTVWAGAPIAQRILPNWRWGYGIWAIVLPILSVPLLLTLFLNQRKAKRTGLLPASPYEGKSVLQVARSLWFDLDLFGLLLLAAATSLILLPLTLAPRAKGGWTNASMIAMLVVGGVCLLAFPFWERSSKLAPKAFFPKELFQNRTVLAGLAIGFFYFMAFYLSVFPYFYSYLLIVQGKSVTAAGHITQTFSFTSTVSSIIVSFLIKYTAHYKYFITFGACIYLVGMGLMYHYRTYGASTATLVGCQIAVGIGGGLLNVPAQLGVQASASHQQVAAATAIFLTIVEIGGACGSAISGAIWSSNVPKKLALYLPPDINNQSLAIYGNVTLASSGWPMGSPERDAINRAYQETMKIILTVAVCIAAPLIPLSLCMGNYKLDKMTQGVKGKVIGGDITETRGSENEGRNPSEGETWRNHASFLGGFKKSRDHESVNF